MNWVLEADIQAFFDSIDRKALLEMIQLRVADGSLLRLIGKCLHVGVLDGSEYSEPEEGTVQGSTLSPLLGNIYLHYALDQWFEREVQPRLGGKALQMFEMLRIQTGFWNFVAATWGLLGAVFTTMFAYGIVFFILEEFF
jgi:retron-type reverse transcriptase